jgi:hypothetical protein
MAKHDENPFEGYDEAINEAMARQQADEEMYAAHEEWKATTWQGKTVSLIQAIGHHFRPFFFSVSEALQEEKSTRILRIIVFFIILLVGIVALYVAAYLVQILIGKEIVIEQEIVIIEEVRQSEIDETVTAQNKKRSNPRSSRDKKTQ